MNIIFFFGGGEELALLELFKGIVSRDEYFFKAYINKQVISVHALIVLPIFCFLVYKKTELRVFSLLLFLELHTNFENPSSNPLQRP